ncbi:MAG: type II toxin-antitoxin system VapC family toxin [Bacteroidota bacterium]
MRLLIDTNIILDIALKRDPFFKDSAELIKKIDNEKITGFITATTITDIYYIAKKEKGNSTAIEFISNLIEFIDIIGIDKTILIEALSTKMPDFEDSIQSVASKNNDIDFIITRNIKDFKYSSIKALTPLEFLNKKRD